MAVGDKAKSLFSITGGVIGAVFGSQILSGILPLDLAGAAGGIVMPVLTTMAGFVAGGKAADILFGHKQEKGHSSHGLAGFMSVTTATIVGFAASAAIAPTAGVAAAIAAKIGIATLGSIIGSAFGVRVSDNVFPKKENPKRKNTLHAGAFSALFSTIGNIIGTAVGVLAGATVGVALDLVGLGTATHGLSTWIGETIGSFGLDSLGEIVKGSGAAGAGAAIGGALGFKIGGYKGGIDGIKRSEKIQTSVTDPLGVRSIKEMIKGEDKNLVPSF